MRDQGIVSASLKEEEKQFEAALRPTRLADFCGSAEDQRESFDRHRGRQTA